MAFLMPNPGQVIQRFLPRLGHVEDGYSFIFVLCLIFHRALG